MTSIFVTHDQTEANALADRIAVMEGGVLQQFASQQDLKERPANLFVATFIGEPPMNVFDAAVVDRRSGSLCGRRRPDASTFADSDIPQTVRAAIGRRDKVVIGIRPHAVRLGRRVRTTPASSPINGSATRAIWRCDVAGKLMVAVSHAPIPAKVGERLRFGVSALGPARLRRRHGGRPYRTGWRRHEFRHARAANAKSRP